MLRSAPYILVIGHVLTVVVSRISMESCGRNTKTLALIAGSPFPFPFRAFLSPPPLFATATLAILLSVIVCFDFVLFSLAPASLRQTVFT